MVMRGWFILLLLLPTTAWGQQTYTKILRPTADAHVRADLPSQNFGGSLRLDVDGSPVEITYLTWDLSVLDDQEIISATLRLWVVNPSNSTQVIKHVEAPWSESLITYMLAPPRTTEVNRFVGGVANVWREIDVTAAVKAKAGALLSLSIDSVGADGFFFSSREAANAPELVVVHGAADVTPPPPPPPGDTTPPTVAITSPIAGAVVSGITPVTITATDASGIQRVELAVDGALRGTAATPPFTIQWDTTNGGAHACIGSHTHLLAARAIDNAGNAATATVMVSMENPAYCSGPPPPPPPTTGGLPCTPPVTAGGPWRCPPLVIDGTLGVSGDATFGGATHGIKYGP